MGYDTRLLSGALSQGTGPETVDADDWINLADAHRYCLSEDSIVSRHGSVLTLLWWKDESQIIALDGDDRDDEDAGDDIPRFGRRRRRQ